MDDLTGVIPLYKPKGMTSHDCVNKLRKILKTKKIGHTGTLDPDVDGVLPMCIGKATKIAEYLSEDGKTYRGVIKLGQSTTTEDASGDIVEEVPIQKGWHRSEIEQVFQRFIGEIEQIPPFYSAVKVRGKRLYEYAREGITVERPRRKVTIHRLELASDDEQFQERIPFVVECSKGTYIRTLTVDIGQALGVPAHMESLTRTRSGAFQLADCLTFKEIEEAVASGTVSALMVSIGEALTTFPSWIVDEKTEADIKHGKVLPLPKNFQNKRMAVYNKKGVCLAIYQVHPERPDVIKPEKVFVVN